MEFDYSKLRGRIIEIYGSQEAFAEKMGLSTRSLSLKMNGKTYWKQPEICKAVKLLNIKDEDILLYFFAIKVQIVEH